MRKKSTHRQHRRSLLKGTATSKQESRRSPLRETAAGRMNKFKRNFQRKRKGIILPLYFGYGLKISLIKLSSKYLNLTSKIFKKRWKEAVVLTLLIAVVGSSFFLFNPDTVKGATYTWVQTDWSGGADTVNFPNHISNQTGWTKYYEKDSNITAGTELALSATADSWTQTSDADFNAGTTTDVQVSGTGDAADLILLPPTTTDSFTDTSKIATSSNINFDTANGQVKLEMATSTLTLRPNGPGDYTELSQYPASGANWDKVDEVTADDDTTYVYLQAPEDEPDNGADVYALQDTSQTGTISEVKVYFRHRGGGSISPRLRLGTNEVTGSSVSAGSSWATSNQVLDRPGGGSWSWTDINNLQAGVYIDVGPNEEGAVTQVYVEVTYSTYQTSGTFTSTNLLEGQSVGPISSFSYNLSSLPAGTTAKVSFSQDNTNWYDSAGTLNGWDTMSAGNNTIDLSGLGWTGANFYYKIEFTSDGSDTPVLDEVSVHTNYPPTGNLI